MSLMNNVANYKWKYIKNKKYFVEKVKKLFTIYKIFDITYIVYVNKGMCNQ